MRFHSEELTAVRRTVLDAEQLADWVPSACATVAEQLRHHGIAPAGYPFARWHPLPDGEVEAEAGFPVTAPVAGAWVAGDEVVEPSILPAGPVLAVWHTDPHQKLAETYHAVDDWLETEHAAATGDSWEIYHDLPTCDHVGTRIEIIQPITFAVT
ncbi:GyrI-like domain-containing protein [Kribbella sp. NPDC004536]|uniref:GyrI-like domain-containing protein n=1 Tax=Kribbella sp. NPDC004536 TaxID=3364106 RepID=UPI003692AA73